MPPTAPPSNCRASLTAIERQAAILTVSEIRESRAWNSLLRQRRDAHILQSWEWGEFKRAAGWQPQRLAFKRDGQVAALASIAQRRIGPLTVMYISKGPLLDYADSALFRAVIAALEGQARQQRAVWLKIDPDVIAATGLPNSPDERRCAAGRAVIDQLTERGWQFSPSQVQFRNTFHIDLRQPERELLMAMSGSTRRKIRTAAKKDVAIRQATLDDLPTLCELYQITAARDDFLIRPLAYYQQAWQTFMQAGLAQAWLAEYNGQALAQLILFHFGARCWYFYGASSNRERQRMPNYALQWTAMQWAKAQGCALYDLWGAPDVFDESDRLWGVYQFKRGFRGQLVRHIGAWDYAPHPRLYAAYEKWLPRLRALF